MASCLQGLVLLTARHHLAAHPHSLHGRTAGWAVAAADLPMYASSGAVLTGMLPVDGQSLTHALLVDQSGTMAAVVPETSSSSSSSVDCHTQPAIGLLGKALHSWHASLGKDLKEVPLVHHQGLPLLQLSSQAAQLCLILAQQGDLVHILVDAGQVAHILGPAGELQR